MQTTSSPGTSCKAKQIQYALWNGDSFGVPSVRMNSYLQITTVTASWTSLSTGEQPPFGTSSRARPAIPDTSIGDHPKIGPRSAITTATAKLIYALPGIIADRSTGMFATAQTGKCRYFRGARPLAETFRSFSSRSTSTTTESTTP